MNHWDDGWPFLSLRLWRALWRDDTALDHAEHWMNIVEPRFRTERFRSFGAGDLFQLGGMTLILLLLGPVLLATLAAGGLLAGAVRGGLTASMVSRLLATQRTNRRLELLGMTPGGVFQACWAMVVYHHLRKEIQHPIASAVQGAQHVLTIMVGLGLAMLGAGTFMSFLGGGLSSLTASSGQDLLRGLMLTIAILLALRYDAATSPLLGAGVGIWGGANTSRQLDGRLWALTVYITIQALMLVGGGLVWWVLSTVLALDFWSSYGLLLLVFFVTHEGVMRYVWRQAAHALDIPYDTVVRFKGLGVGVQSTAIKMYVKRLDHHAAAPDYPPR